MKLKHLFLTALFVLVGGGSVWAGPETTTPVAGNTYYLYNPKTDCFLKNESGTPYVKATGDAWTFEQGDGEYSAFYTLKLKDTENDYFWGKFWALIAGDWAKYPAEHYFKLAETTGGYTLNSQAWAGTDNALVYVNSGNANRVAANSQEQRNLDANYTVWQFVSEEDYSTYVSEKRISSMPYSTDFSSANPFVGGSVVDGTNVKSVLNVNNTTATAWFGVGGSSPYTLSENEEVTVSFTAFHGWLGSGSNQSVSLLNSDGVVLAEYTYNLGSGTITGITVAGQPQTITAYDCRSRNGSQQQNGLTGNGRPYMNNDNYNPHFTFVVREDGSCGVNVLFNQLGINTTYTAKVAQGVKKDLAKIVVTSRSNNGDRTICIDDLNITSATKYSYTINAGCTADGKNTMILKELQSGVVLPNENVTIAFPQYLLVGTTLFNAAAQSGDYYHKTFTINQGSYVGKVDYNGNIVENVVFYTEAEHVAGVTVVGGQSTRASMGNLGHTSSSNTYKQVTTILPGKYKIYLRGLNGNSASRAVNFKVGEDVVFTTSIPNGNNQLRNSEEFVVSEESVLSFASEGSSASGVDWFYIVQTGFVPFEGADATCMINNHSFESDFTGWTNTNMDTQANISISKAGKKYAEKWQPNGTFGVSQSIANLPAGIYKLTVHGRTRGTSSAYVYMNNEQKSFDIDDSEKDYEVTAIVEPNSTVTIGAQCVGTGAGSSWFAIDNFRLTYLGEVSSATMAVNATAKYGTFCAPFDVVLPEGVESYTATVEEGKIVLTEGPTAGKTLAAHTPVVLKAADGLDATTFYGKAVSGNPTAGALTGVYELTETPAGAYLLQMNNGVVGFYNVDGLGTHIGANRCYLTSSESGARAFVIDGDATLIEKVETTAPVEVVFDLAGRKVMNAKKGLYIVNGKKVIR